MFIKLLEIDWICPFEDDVYIKPILQGKDSSTLGRLFVLRLLEEMHILGYDLVTSTDLSRFNLDVFRSM
jgi:hypothetical protein